MRGTFRRILELALARGFGTLVSLITLIFSARYLGAEGRGIYVAAFTWMITLCTLFHLSIGPALQYRIQKNKAAYETKSMMGSMLGLIGILSIFAWTTALIAYLVTNGKIFGNLPAGALILAFASLPLMMWEHYAPNIYTILAKMHLINRAQYIGKLSGLLVFFILVVILKKGVYGALAAVFFSQLLTMLVSIVPLLRELKWKVMWLSNEVKPLLFSGLKIHVSSVTALLLDQASILIVNFYLTNEDLGYFQLAVQLVGLILILPQSALVTLYGDMTKSNPSENWAHQKNVITHIMLAVLALSLVSAYLAPYLIPIVAGSQFIPSVPIFISLLPSLLGLSLSILLTPQWLGRGYFMLGNIFTSIALVFVVVGSVWMVPLYGIDGAIYIRVIVYGVLLPVAFIVFWTWCNKQATKDTS